MWARVRENEAQLSLALSLVIGAVVGLVVVAFIVLTGRLAVRMYPPGGAAWRRVLVPTLGSLVTGFLLFRYFPFARGSGIPQTKYALFVEDGRITMRTVIGKFLCCCTALASGVSLGREGPSVQVGAGIASGISAAYYPSVYQTWTKVGQRWLTNVIIDGSVFCMNEFWPDVNNRFFHQKD